VNESDPCAEAPLLAAVLDDISEGVLVLDRDYRIALANRRLGELVGMDEADILGAHCADVLGSRLCGADCPVTRARRTRQRVAGMTTWLAPEDQEPRPVAVSVRPLRGRGQDGDRSLGCLLTLTELEGAPLRESEFAEMIGRSSAMRRIFQRVRLLADSDASVLVSGESGTGKELVARALHSTGRRRRGPWVPLNCAALPADLLESELFGQVRGAFTGTVQDQAGRIAAARGGTLFLDEVGELPLELQPKLLRLLEDPCCSPAGEDRDDRAHIRVVAASKADLAAAVASGSFRADLYYRLRVIPIELPPLRDRREDIPLLAGTLLQRRVRAAHRSALRLSAEVMELLQGAPWPGNVRELLNVLDYLVARAPGPVVEPRDLPVDLLQGCPTGATPRSAARPQKLASPPRDRRRYSGRPGPQEESAVQRALERNGWHREASATELGMDRVTLYRRMKRYGIEPPRRG